MAKSQFIKYIADAIPKLQKKVNMGDVVKRHEITTDDVVNADTVALSPYSEPELDKSDCYFLAFDFDTKGKSGIAKMEAEERADLLLEIIAASPAIIQKSKGGSGVHLLVKCKPFEATQDFFAAMKSVCQFFAVDKHSMTKNCMIDLLCKNAKENAFTVIKEVAEDKPFAWNKDSQERLLNAVNRRKTLNATENIILQKIKDLSETSADSHARNSKLNSYVYFAFQLFHYGIKTEQVYQLFKSACEKNGYIAEEGIKQFDATFKSASEAGKQSPITSIVDIELTGLDLIVDLDEQTELDICKNSLRLLPNNIYYIADTQQFYCCVKNVFFSTLEDACTNSGIRFFTNNKKNELKRITTNNYLLAKALNKVNIGLVGFSRIINLFTTRPCLIGKTVIKTSGFSEGGVFAQIHESKPIDVMAFLGKYFFASERSKALALAAIFAAFTTNNYVKPNQHPGFYYHAYSQAGCNSGKTTLASVTCHVRSENIIYANISDNGNNALEETRKKITSGLLKGSRAVLMDNLPSFKNYLKFSELDAWLTCPVFSQRLLSVHKDFEIPNNILFTLTGNQIELSDDLKRRVATIVFSGRYESEKEENGIDVVEAGNGIAWGMVPLIEKWLESDVSIKSESKLRNTVTSWDKYTQFWKDFYGFCFANGIDFGNPSEFEIEDGDLQVIEYDDVLDILAGQHGTAKSLFEYNKEDLQNFFKCKNISRKLGRILADLSQRGDTRVVIDDEKENNANVYWILTEKKVNKDWSKRYD